MLDRGADPNAVDERDESPLMASLLHLPVLTVLLERGADPNRHSPLPIGSTALLELVRRKPGEYMQ